MLCIEGLSMKNRSSKKYILFYFVNFLIENQYVATACNVLQKNYSNMWLIYV
jgi:hypothetical protein